MRDFFEPVSRRFVYLVSVLYLKSKQSETLYSSGETERSLKPGKLLIFLIIDILLLIILREIARVDRIDRIES